MYVDFWIRFFPRKTDNLNDAHRRRTPILRNFNAGRRNILVYAWKNADLEVSALRHNALQYTVAEEGWVKIGLHLKVDQ